MKTNELLIDFSISSIFFFIFFSWKKNEEENDYLLNLAREKQNWNKLTNLEHLFFELTLNLPKKRLLFTVCSSYLNTHLIAVYLFSLFYIQENMFLFFNIWEENYFFFLVFLLFFVACEQKNKEKKMAYQE